MLEEWQIIEITKGDKLQFFSFNSVCFAEAVSMWLCNNIYRRKILLFGKSVVAREIRVLVLTGHAPYMFMV